MGSVDLAFLASSESLDAVGHWHLPRLAELALVNSSATPAEIFAVVENAYYALLTRELGFKMGAQLYSLFVGPYLLDFSALLVLSTRP